jgi:hypothetical protein
MIRMLDPQSVYHDSEDDPRQSGEPGYITSRSIQANLSLSCLDSLLFLSMGLKMDNLLHYTLISRSDERKILAADIIYVPEPYLESCPGVLAALALPELLTLRGEPSDLSRWFGSGIKSSGIACVESWVRNEIPMGIDTSLR